MSAASALCNVAYNALRRPRKENDSRTKGCAAFGLAESELLTRVRNSNDSRALVSSPINGYERMREMRRGYVEIAASLAGPFRVYVPITHIAIGRL